MCALEQAHNLKVVSSNLAPATTLKSQQYREKKNRRKAVLYFLLRVERQFDCVHMISIRFNRLSGFFATRSQ